MLLMDIGGWTVGLMRLVNGIPNASACRSLELGMIRCIDEAKEQVRWETGLSVTDAQVEHVLRKESEWVIVRDVFHFDMLIFLDIAKEQMISPKFIRKKLCIMRYWKRSGP